MKKRYESLDFLKALSIFLVVFYHNICSTCNMAAPGGWDFFNYFVRGLMDPFVPLFFLVNGALLLNRKFSWRAHLIRTLKVAINMYLWAWLTLVLTRDGSPFKKGTYIRLLTWDSSTLTHFWFLRVLLVLYLMFPAIKWLFDRFPKLYAATLGAGAILVFAAPLLEARFAAISYLLQNIIVRALLYFVLGGLAWKEHDRLDRPRLRKVCAAVLPVSALLLTGYGAWLSRSAGSTWDIVANGYGTVFTAVNVLCLFVLSIGLESRGSSRLQDFFRLIGENTLGIFFFHVIIGGKLLPFYKLLPICSWLPLNLLYAFCLMMVSLGVTLIVKKIPLLRETLQ